MAEDVDREPEEAPHEERCKGTRVDYDGPHFDPTGLADGDLWDGRRPFFEARCRTCDEVVVHLGQTAGPRHSYDGARWSVTHRTFVFGRGTVGREEDGDDA